MNIIHRCCCGIDVHAKTVVVCLINNGKKQIRTYSTMTDDLLALSDWLVSEGCEQVAIESTGVYWKPVFNILEGVLEVVLVNARQRKSSAWAQDRRARLRMAGRPAAPTGCFVRASFRRCQSAS